MSTFDNRWFESLAKPIVLQKTVPCGAAKRRASSQPAGGGKRQNIFTKLTDPCQYTGTHRHRFDPAGRGMGLSGRDSIPKDKGNLPPDIVLNRPCAKSSSSVETSSQSLTSIRSSSSALRSTSSVCLSTTAGSVKAAFSMYCGQKSTMDGKTFAKLCRDCGLIEGCFTLTEVDLLFNRVVPKGQRRISYTLFIDALDLIAEKKDVAPRSVRSAVAHSCGPILHGTVGDPVRFHDDKSTYGGVHAYKVASNAAKGMCSDGFDARLPDSPSSSLSPKSSPMCIFQCLRKARSMEETFWAYCGAADSMDGRSFAKLCRDCGLLDEQLTRMEVDVIFSKVVPIGQRRIDLPTFVHALRLIANKKDAPFHTVKSSVANSHGPVLCATAPDQVELHDNKHGYTGIHRSGSSPDGKDREYMVEY